jgi:hypothetical protein
MADTVAGTTSSNRRLLVGVARIVPAKPMLISLESGKGGAPMA